MGVDKEAGEGGWGQGGLCSLDFGLRHIWSRCISQSTFCYQFPAAIKKNCFIAFLARDIKIFSRSREAYQKQFFVAGVLEQWSVFVLFHSFNIVYFTPTCY